MSNTNIYKGDQVMFANSINILSDALNAAWIRNQVISNNIANVDTPNFKRSIVKFEDILASALEGKKVVGYTTNPRHIPIGNGVNVQPVIEKVDDTSYRMDGNNVDIDNEMVQLAKNNLWYDSLITRLSGEFNSIKSVINSGR